ncbi:NADP-dependent oxidoreductase [Streptomyces sp. GXMU-J15]|uniref:NADP-dependent oxidoreductase n=1 Tax=Streptomyces fuscus TaxID=3048495 RepID=A0ABT7IW18_9ACTN|nr:MULTISPECIES: NADP-dependent oxidoreductase [Streptomyces]MDL2076361.1 NADP-dependent oxidoreductase [Streptomyces fuscus]SBT89046.1 NADPH:quinone reductase [Streptomyces sp. DI166]
MGIDEHMRAVVARGYGGVEVLELVTVPLPEPGPGQVRVRVEAATVNPVDLVTRSGALVEAGLMTARECTGIGWDVAGIVDQVGVGAGEFVPGQRVVGMRDLLDVSVGAYAEYLVLDATAVAPAPPGVSAAAAATLPLNGLTALQSLDLLDLVAGDTLLVTGAAGAVGGFAVELAVRRGLRVIAQAGAADEDYVRGLGAEWVVGRDTSDLAGDVRRLVPGGVSGALDTAGLGVRALAAVRTRGAYVTVVGGSAPLPLRGIRVHQQWISADGAALAELAAMDLTLRVADVLPLERAAEAHDRLAAGGIRGRLVLAPRDGA